MNRRVLLIDADPEFQGTLTAELGRYRITVVAEPDPDAGVQLAAADPPAMIVIGVEEPEKAGFRVFQKCKKGALAKVPIALVTASVSPESFAKHRGLKVHADEYIDKRTIQLDELLAKIDALIQLGEPEDPDALDIPVEDDIPMELGDSDVIDETVGEDANEFDVHGAATVGPGSGIRIDSVVEAETDAAFDALLGPDDVPAAKKRAGSEPAIVHEPALPPEDSGVPEPVPHAGRADQQTRPPPIANDALAVPELVPHPHRPDSGMYQPVPDEQPVPMPVRAARSSPHEEATVARVPVITDAAKKTGSHPAIDLGLEQVETEARNEQSGTFDRRSLRQIGELERQIAQLKQELDRARAATETATKGAGREAQFLSLREQVATRDKELKQAKADAQARDAELAALRAQLDEAHQANAQLHAQHAELSQLIAAGEAAAARVAALEHELAQSQRVLTDAHAAHAAALVQQRDELDNAHAGAREEAIEELRRANVQEHEAAIAELEKKHAKELVSLKADHAGELARVTKELAAARSGSETSLAEAGEAHAAELAQLKAKAEADLAALEDELNEARERDAESHGQALAQLKQELDRSIAAHEVKLATARREMEQLIAQHEDHKGQLHEQHRAELARLEAVHEQERVTAAGERAQLVEAAKRAAEVHQAELAEAHAQAEREATEQRAALAAAQRAAGEIEERAASERQQLQDAHEQALAEQQAKHERAIAVANGEALKQKSVADAEHAKAVAAAKAELEKRIGELEAEKDELRRGLSSARDTLKRSEGELASAVQTIAERNADLRSHVSAIAERDQRIAELRGEIEALETENQSYQDQVLRAYQKIKSDEAMVARARKAMAIALTVLDDEPPQSS